MRQEDCKFKASLGHRERPCLKKPTPKQNKTNSIEQFAGFVQANGDVALYKSDQNPFPPLEGITINKMSNIVKCLEHVKHCEHM
jgi:hypothetical protein